MLFKIRQVKTCTIQQELYNRTSLITYYSSISVNKNVKEKRADDGLLKDTIQNAIIKSNKSWYAPSSQQKTSMKRYFELFKVFKWVKGRFPKKTVNLVTLSKKVGGGQFKSQ